jgi:hypothetical protein
LSQHLHQYVGEVNSIFGSSRLNNNSKVVYSEAVMIMVPFHKHFGWVSVAERRKKRLGDDIVKKKKEDYLDILRYPLFFFV